MIRITIKNFKKNIFFSFLIAIPKGMRILAYSFLARVLQGIPLHFLSRDVKFERFNTENAAKEIATKTQRHKENRSIKKLSVLEP